MTFTVRDIYPEVKKILGTCGDAAIFSKLTQAVEVLSNSGDFDPLLGYVDLCVNDCVVTLPREIDTVLAVNIGGHASVGRDFLYRFHLNGLGDCKNPCIYQWEDKGLVPVFSEMDAPSKLICFVDVEADAGKEIWAYGYDADNKWIRTEEGGVWKEGYRVPTVYGFAMPETNAPFFSRVVRVRKAETIGPLKLTSFDVSDTTGAVLGIFEFDETDPQYRQIRVSNLSCGWVRIAYRKRLFKIKSLDDLIPLPGMLPVLMMLRALKRYDDNDLATATGFEATARRLLTEAAWAHSPPVGSGIQMNDNVSVGHDKDSYFVD
jgi:hypothetical protein